MNFMKPEIPTLARTLDWFRIPAAGRVKHVNVKGSVRESENLSFFRIINSLTFENEKGSTGYRLAKARQQIIARLRVPQRKEVRQIVRRVAAVWETACV